MIQFPEDNQKDATARQQEAKKLIEAARSHHLGTEFLRDGALDSVAATFKVHAFVVDRARELLD